MNPWYGSFTVAWVGLIYWLSAIPNLVPEEDRRTQLVMNLGHVPMFGVLTFCLFKTIVNNRQPSRTAVGAIFLGAAVVAVLDEWHQAFVPGRQVSLGDLLLDLTGIGGMLIFLHYRTPSRRSSPRDTPPQIP
jgi:VanZ family protein